jgi:tetratricopeptide (TPR) repeat protein
MDVVGAESTNKAHSSAASVGYALEKTSQPKEGIMKVSGLLLNGLLALSLVAVLPQHCTAQSAKIHGHVTHYTGVAQNAGIICLSSDGGLTPAFSFPVDAKGNYAGEAPAGAYTLIFRMPDTPAGEWIDLIHNVVLAPGADLEQNDDMSRQEFIDELPDETKKQLQDLKKQNASTRNQDSVVTTINGDLQQAFQDFKDADNARNVALRELGKAANPAALDAKAQSIRAPKYARIESLMHKDLQSFKDSGLSGDETPLLENLGRAQIGLKKYDAAEYVFKKILELQTASSSPSPAVQANANAHLGEIDIRTGKTAEAVTAFDTAAQLDAAHAALFLRTEAYLFLQEGNTEAQIAAADKAISADPKDPFPYYIRANGLFKNAGIDIASKHYDLPDGCAEAYQKYLALAPNGPYAAEAQSVLRRAEKSVKAAE